MCALTADALYLSLDLIDTEKACLWFTGEKSPFRNSFCDLDTMC